MFSFHNDKGYSSTKGELTGGSSPCQEDLKTVASTKTVFFFPRPLTVAEKRKELMEEVWVGGCGCGFLKSPFGGSEGSFV